MSGHVSGIGSEVTGSDRIFDHVEQRQIVVFAGATTQPAFRTRYRDGEQRGATVAGVPRVCRGRRHFLVENKN